MKNLGHCAKCGGPVGNSNYSGFCQRCKHHTRCRACGTRRVEMVDRLCPACRAFKPPPRHCLGKRPPPGVIDAIVAHYAARASLELPLFGAPHEIGDAA